MIVAGIVCAVLSVVCMLLAVLGARTRAERAVAYSVARVYPLGAVLISTLVVWVV